MRYNRIGYCRGNIKPRVNRYENDYSALAAFAAAGALCFRLRRTDAEAEVREKSCPDAYFLTKVWS